MKQFIVACMLIAVVAGAPNQYGMAQASYNSNQGAPAQSQSYSGPDQQFNSQQVSYVTPQVSFVPPQITYSQPAVTYSQPQTISVPVQQQSYSAPPAYIPSSNYGSAIQMGYQAQASSQYQAPASGYKSY